ncbi:hypothetical protein HD554DRAFT_864833 [Boletus coccyginus]|nr:hypothetical protein HD554DRAFT_864833 [Boletus coccyginus]
MILQPSHAPTGAGQLGARGSFLSDVKVADLQIEDAPTLTDAPPYLGKEMGSAAFVSYPKAKERPLQNDILYYLLAGHQINYLHSSGSTGFPKPIPITNLTVVHSCIMSSIQDHANFSSTCSLVLPFFLHSTSSKAPTIPNPQNTIEVVQSTRLDSITVTPGLLLYKRR